MTTEPYRAVWTNSDLPGAVWNANKFQGFSKTISIFLEFIFIFHELCKRVKIYSKHFSKHFQFILMRNRK